MLTRTRNAIVDDEKLDVLLACRPVYTRNQDVAAFELLSDRGDHDAPLSDLWAANTAILGTYNDIYQHGQVDTVPNILRLAPTAILTPAPAALPKKQYILEIDVVDPSHHTPIADLVERLRTLAHHGHRLALAGYHPDREDLTPLLDTVHIVRLDRRQLGLDGIATAVSRLRPSGVELLADNLDSRDQFRDCLGLGVTYFQGDFLGKPVPVKGKKITGNKVLLLQLLSELHNPGTSPAALERIVIKDAQLTYRILKVVNSAAVGLSRDVDSVSHAIALLGMEEIKRWANLLLVDGEPGKPEALTRSMLVRGRMCEILAELSGQADPMNHFIVGLLSRLDALMDISMEDLMEQVPLSQDVKNALLHRGGESGRLLTEVENYENGRFDRLTWVVDEPFYEVAYRHSTGWARQAQQALSS